jgi:hypothetical protein
MKTISTLIFSILFLVSCGQTTKHPTPSKQENNLTSQKAITPIWDTIFDFNKYKLGEIPSGWSEYATGKDASTKWIIANDNGKQVLAQVSSDHPNYHFNVIVYNKMQAKDVELEVKLKGVAGNMDQGGGFVWRYIDADNYYVVRANPLEDNVVMYKVKNGKRTDLPLLNKGRTYGVDVPKLGNGWNTLKLIAQGDLFTVYLNNLEIFQVQDQTFTQAGKVGLWTKADAVSHFDEFHISLLK